MQVNRRAASTKRAFSKAAKLSECVNKTLDGTFAHALNTVKTVRASASSSDGSAERTHSSSSVSKRERDSAGGIAATRCEHAIAAENVNASGRPVSLERDAKRRERVDHGADVLAVKNILDGAGVSGERGEEEHTIGERFRSGQCDRSRDPANVWQPAQCIAA
jgi:hypothetical protein